MIITVKIVSLDYVSYILFDVVIADQPNRSSFWQPEKEIYKVVEAYTQKPSSEHIFIDDIKEYVEGAKQCGWDAIQFVGYQNLVEELKKRKIL